MLSPKRHCHNGYVTYLEDDLIQGAKSDRKTLSGDKELKMEYIINERSTSKDIICPFLAACAVAQHHCICKYGFGTHRLFLDVLYCWSSVVGPYYAFLSLCPMNPQGCSLCVSLSHCAMYLHTIQNTLTLAWLLINLLATVSTGWKMKSSRIPEVALPKKRARPDSECFLPEGGGDIEGKCKEKELLASITKYFLSLEKFSGTACLLISSSFVSQLHIHS